VCHLRPLFPGRIKVYLLPFF
jgi:hypothetical protein